MDSRTQTFTADIKSSNSVTRSLRINNSNNNRKYFRFCNRNAIRMSLYNKNHRKDRRLRPDTMQNTLSNCNIKRIRIST